MTTQFQTTNQDDESLDLDGIKEVMQFDPFGPPSNSGSDDEGGGQDTTEGGEGQDTLEGGGQDTVQGGDTSQQPPVKKPAATTTQTPAQAPSEGDPKDKTIEGLRSQIATLLAKPTPAAEPAKPSGAPAAGEEQAREQNPYNIVVSDQLVAGMTSEEPAQQKAAVSALANAVMNKLYQDFSQALVQMRKELIESLPTVVTQTQNAKTAQQQIEEDFYTAFPELKSDLLKPTVWNVVGQVAQRLGVNTWTEELRNTAGEYLLDQLKITRQAPPASGQQTQQTQGTGGRAPRKTFAAGSGNGAARPNGSGAAENEFADVLTVGGGF